MTDHAKKPEDGWANPLWERQPGETDKAFQAFVLYRDAGPMRSVTNIGLALDKSRTLIGRWSSDWGWVERASAWDDEADRLARERDLLERQHSRTEMLDGHAKLGKAMTQIAAQGFLEYDASNPMGKQRIKAMGPAELARLAQTGAQMERLARGETTERIEVKAAMAWVEGFIDISLSYLPPETHEAFLVDIDSRLGVGGMSVR